MPTPPLIGVTSYREVATWGVWSQAADVLHREYADSVVAAGGVPVLLPPATDTVEAAEVVVSRLDGLVISGGADVDPRRYGQSAHPRTSGWRDDRDGWETALLIASEQAQLPLLGVCRGMQLMAARQGGALDQHTPDVVGHEGHGPSPSVFGDIAVRTDPASRVAKMIGAQVVVPCHHHQSVREAPGFVATAWAEDGTVEAIEAPGARFCVAIQWHPEKGADLGLFHGLVEAARLHRDGLEQ